MRLASVRAEFKKIKNYNVQEIHFKLLIMKIISSEILNELFYIPVQPQYEKQELELPPTRVDSSDERCIQL